MGFDVKVIVDQVVEKSKSDPDFMKKLQTEPEKTIESLIGVDIPDGAVDKVVAGIKGKIAVDKLSGLGKLFGK